MFYDHINCVTAAEDKDVHVVDLKGVTCPSVCGEQVTREWSQLQLLCVCVCVCACVCEREEGLALGKDTVTICYFLKVKTDLLSLSKAL